ncbi:YkgJ family cysteine cluster protein [Desulfohalovibrio reitneri]|uniref:YkgJ family cysteine cluster protein n=1 Tax=Desulfohalovibrio reitneri TaxID=1307759 RepID=UPI0004A71FA9|nr:YkgJ family cysteine cluster protein [Desulfohalovibrio reitneri]
MSECQRCGECCKQGGPALHREDLDLVESGPVGLAHLLTLRAGEPAFDQVAGAVAPLAGEIVKLAPAPGGAWTCRFYVGEAGCSIYRNRPLECRLLDCRDPSALAAAYDRDRLVRADLLEPDSALAELVRAHQETCPVERALELGRRARTGESAARRELEAMCGADQAFRQGLTARAPEAEAWLGFLFGRELERVVRRAMNASF